ncbi:MAG: hypothetical protein ACW964_02345 [Candidatus Hodarchaeales archaeon]|jgi:hypothetical protein
MAAPLLFISIIALCDAFIIAVILVLGIKSWIKTRYKQFFWFSLGFFGDFAWIFLVGLQLLLISIDPESLSINFLMTDIGIPLMKLTPDNVSMTLADVLGFTGFFCVTGFTLFFVIFVDSANRTTFDPIKFSIYGIIAFGMVYGALLPGVEAKVVSYFLANIQTIFWSFKAILWVIYIGNLYTKVPKDKRNRIGVAFLGAILMLLAQLMSFTRLIPLDLGIVEMTILLGYLLFMISFVLEPRLLFILPFKTSRLVVVNTKTKKPLFSYSWARNNDENIEDLYPGMIAAVDALSSGLHELQLKESKLLINHHLRISCIIVTSKASKALNNSLEIFTNRVAKTFDTLPEIDFTQKEYNVLDTIVHESFPFIQIPSTS